MTYPNMQQDAAMTLQLADCVVALIYAYADSDFGSEPQRRRGHSSVKNSSRGSRPSLASVAGSRATQPDAIRYHAKIDSLYLTHRVGLGVRRRTTGSVGDRGAMTTAPVPELPQRHHHSS